MGSGAFPSSRRLIRSRAAPRHQAQHSPRWVRRGPRMLCCAAPCCARCAHMSLLDCSTSLATFFTTCAQRGHRGSGFKGAVQNRGSGFKGVLQNRGSGLKGPVRRWPNCRPSAAPRPRPASLRIARQTPPHTGIHAKRRLEEGKAGLSSRHTHAQQQA